MAEREVKIRLSANDAGASSTVKALTKQMGDLAKAGQDTKVLFSAEFHDAQVQKRVAEIVSRMQAEADKHHITIEAQSIEREANRQLFGAQRGPLPMNAPSTVSTAAIVEAAASEGYKRAVRTASTAGEQAAVGWLGGLKKALGGRSDAKDLLELFVRGSGPIAAVALGATAFSQMGKAMKDAATEGRSVGAAMLQSIPLIGTLVRGAKDWADALSGAAERAGALKAHMADLAAQKAQQQAAAGQLPGLQGIINAGVMAGAEGNPAGAAITRASQQLNADNAAIAEAQAQLDALTAKTKAAMRSGQSESLQEASDRRQLMVKLEEDIARAKIEASNRYYATTKEGYAAEEKAVAEAESAKLKAVEDGLRQRRILEREEADKRVALQKQIADEDQAAQKAATDARKQGLQSELDAKRGQLDTLKDDFAARDRARREASTLTLGGAEVSRFGSGRADLMREQFKSSFDKDRAADAKNTAANTKKLTDQIAELITLIRGDGTGGTVVLN